MHCINNNCPNNADELIINTRNLSEYVFTCPVHRDKYLRRPYWYRASEDVKQVVLMNEAKDLVRDRL